MFKRTAKKLSKYLYKRLVLSVANDRREKSLKRLISIIFFSPILVLIIYSFSVFYILDFYFSSIGRIDVMEYLSIEMCLLISSMIFVMDYIDDFNSSVIEYLLKLSGTYKESELTNFDILCIKVFDKIISYIPIEIFTIWPHKKSDNNIYFWENVINFCLHIMKSISILIMFLLSSSLNTFILFLILLLYIFLYLFLYLLFSRAFELLRRKYK